MFCEDRMDWYEVTPDTFDFYGMLPDFTRMPIEEARKVSGGVQELSRYPAGGRIRFTTDSCTICLRAEIAYCSIVGFDLYRTVGSEERFVTGFRLADSFICEGDFRAQSRIAETAEMRALTLNFPYRAEIRRMYIGLDAGSALTRGAPYRNPSPVIWYGSSITQGSWASRPGLTYEAMISQRYNLHYLNFGFSGNARGEREIAEYLAPMEMCAFVLDYDHNAPTVQELRETHEPFYRIIRTAHPDIPILMLTKPDYAADPAENQKRADVIFSTYLSALARGEKVFFIEGKTLFAGDYYHNMTRDGTHPNDIGFYRMASVVGPVLAGALGIESTPYDTEI